jgi:cell division protein ZipA
MDKEILRIVIIATGLVVIMGMIFWSYLKGKKAERESDVLFDKTLPHFAGLSASLKGQQVDAPHDDFDIIPLGPAGSFKKSDSYFDETDSDEGDDDIDPVPRLITPSLIQFSLVANADEGFNGAELAKAFQLVGLEYGSMKIYERVDASRLVDFAVACMVEPGTFPETDQENFFCPGLVFFMQPGELENAQAVFDDFVETIRLLAEQLDGVIWDHQRQPLIEETVQAIRRSL